MQPQQVQQQPAFLPPQDEEKERKSRRRRLMFTAILAGASLAILYGMYIRRTSKSNSSASLGDNKEQNTGRNDRSGTETPQGDPAELLDLAKRAKKAGLKIQGVSQCGWTKRQREMFGGAGDEARKTIEEIYVECRSRDMCPGIRGYPTWVKDGKQFPGFKDANSLVEILKELESSQQDEMLKMPAVPENTVVIEEIKEEEPEEKATEPAKEEKREVEIPVKTAEPVKTPEKPKLPQDETPQEIDTTNSTVEKARGVSSFPPMNVPAMPGTQSWHIEESHAHNQNLQGNTPRLVGDQRAPVADVARQMASTFQQMAHDAARDPESASFADNQLPQSANVSSGDATADKRI